MTETEYVLETPGGIELVLRPAGAIARGGAFLADEIIRWAIIVPCVFSVGVLSVYLGRGATLVTAFALLMWFIVSWFYGVVFEVFRNGRTPGKAIFGLQVIHDDGTPVRFPASLLRNLLLAADFLPIFYIAGITTMSVSTHFRRLGDHAAGTLVIYADKLQRSAATDVSGVRVPPVALTQTERSCFIEFLDRHHSFSAERSEELAAILHPIIHEQGSRAVRTVCQIGNGIRGGV